MKIIFATSFIHTPKGGIQQYGRDFLRALRATGQTVQHVEMRGSGGIAKALFALRVLGAVAFSSKCFIIVNHVNYAPLAATLKRFLQKPFAVLTYGIEVWDVASASKRAALAQADWVLTISRFTAAKLLSKGYVTQSKLWFIEPTLDTKRFSPQAQSSELVKQYSLAGRQVIFYLGRLAARERYKGYDRVVRALPSVLKNVPNASYLILGDGDDLERTRQLAKELGVQDKVVFLDPDLDARKQDFYNLADVFVMPSTGEGFGIVYLEALSCGVPVIAGNKDASSEPLLNGKLGILIDPENVKQLAEALVKVLKGQAVPELYNKQYLHEQVEANFGWESFQHKVNEFIAKIS